MSFVPDRFVVVLDANVLYPFRKRDLLLSFYDAGLFRGRWTRQILDEWVSNLLAKKPQLEGSINQQLEAIREAFPESEVTGHGTLIDGLSLPDPDDRHVLAAAIVCGAQHIVTDNLKDFPLSATVPYGIEAISPDEFLHRTFELYPARATAVLRDVRKRYDNPPYTPAEFVLDLVAKGLPKLAAQARATRELI